MSRINLRRRSNLTGGIPMGSLPLQIRGKDYCRACDSPNLFSVLDLGELPIANELWKVENFSKEEFPLHLRICEDCGLGQVEDVVTPDRLFSDYRYLSSVSTSFSLHAKNYCDDIIQTVSLSPDDLVIEIASNDGYLLRHFIDRGIQVLGIEPAANIAQQANDSGIRSLNKFFGSDLAKEILSEYGNPKLVVANNVLAHVPDIQDFIFGISILMGAETTATIENPSLSNFLKGDQFDTIYHEHYSYLTAFSVDKLARSVGLELFKVEEIETHGGSLRYWLRKSTDQDTISNEVRDYIDAEVARGLLDGAKWKDFASATEKTISDFRNWVEESLSTGRRIYGYGAAAKASTLLNSAKIKPNAIIAIADNSPEKQDRFMPVMGAPIISATDLYASSVTDIVIFPWNIIPEILSEIRLNLPASVKIWRAVPNLEEVV
jgi:hypothetical protein